MEDTRRNGSSNSDFNNNNSSRPDDDISLRYGNQTASLASRLAFKEAALLRGQRQTIPERPLFRQQRGLEGILHSPPPPLHASQMVTPKDPGDIFRESESVTILNMYTHTCILARREKEPDKRENEREQRI